MDHTKCDPPIAAHATRMPGPMVLRIFRNDDPDDDEMASGGVWGIFLWVKIEKSLTGHAPDAMRM